MSSLLACLVTGPTFKAWKFSSRWYQNPLPSHTNAPCHVNCNANFANKYKLHPVQWIPQRFSKTWEFYIWVIFFRWTSKCYFFVQISKWVYCFQKSHIGSLGHPFLCVEKSLCHLQNSFHNSQKTTVKSVCFLTESNFQWATIFLLHTKS